MNGSDAGAVLGRADGPVAVLTLNRPRRLNAWTPELEDRLFTLLDEAFEDPSVRAVVVTGAGRGFCAGADLDLLGAVDPEHPVLVGGRRRPAELLAAPKPVIAAVNGPCAGVGLLLAAMCDLRFAAPTATFTGAYTRVGLPAEGGLSWRLPRLIGAAAAFDLLACSRTVDAGEARVMGLVDRVLPAADLLPEACAYAGRLAEASPHAIALVKWQLAAHASATSERSLVESDRLVDRTLRSGEVTEALRGLREHRPPPFPALDRDRLAADIAAAQEPASDP